jgi:apolipoprotein N-acyltransferase
MFVDPYGRVTGETKIFISQTVIGTLPLRKGMTFYTKYGDLFPKSCVVISLGLLFVSLIQNRKLSITDLETEVT